MNRKPVCVAYNEDKMVTCVTAFPGQEAVFVGFRDGAVQLAELDETQNAIILSGTTGAEVTAIELSSISTQLFVGDADGNVLWAPLRPGD